MSSMGKILIVGAIVWFISVFFSATLCIYNFIIRDISWGTAWCCVTLLSVLMEAVTIEEIISSIKNKEW